MSAPAPTPAPTLPPKTSAPTTPPASTDELDPGAGGAGGGPAGEG